MKKINKPKVEALLQILILVIGIVAISYAIGSSVVVVSASGGDCGDGGTCINIDTETCDGDIKIDLCPEANNIRCCVPFGYYVADEDGTGLIPVPKNLVTTNPNGDVTSIETQGIEPGSGLGKALGGSLISGVTQVGVYKLTYGGAAAAKTAAEITALQGQVAALTASGTTVTTATAPTLGSTLANMPLATIPAETSKLALLFGKTAVGAEKSFWVATGSGAGQVSLTAYIFGTLIVAAATAALIIGLAKLMGAGKRNMQQIVPAALASAGGVAGLSIALATAAGGPPMWAVAAAIAAITGIYTFFTYQKYSQDVFTYTAYVWKPVEGGKDCEKCNDLRYGCNEYQCHAFGEACEIVNAGTEEEKCVSIKDDGRPPTIIPLKSVLPEGYRYVESDAVLPPARGVKILYDGNNNGCVPPFTSVVLGVETNEPAECKIDVERRQLFDEMISYLEEGSAKVYNHTLALPASSTPSAEAMENVGWNIENGRQHKFYIRCRDMHGNTAPTNFVMEFCVDDGPDIKSPTILGTNYLQESYIAYNQSSVPLEVYTDEPADCKWDFEDKAYDQMSREMDFCSQSANDYIDSSSFSYGCSGTLEGVKNNIENKYYIRCKDKPWLEGDEEAQGKRYENRESYVLTLKGTQKLIITSVKVNGGGNDTIIKGSVDPVKVILEVETSAGADDGRAKCQYESNGKYYYFYNKGSPEYLYQNTQRLDLSKGDYTLPIKCIDLGGNTDTTTINFSVEIDTSAPEITRVYREGDDLKLITDEEAECRYGTSSNVGCDYNFEEGTLMISMDNDFEHYVDWESNTNFYIKCGEIREGGRYPPQNECSLIVRPFDVL